MRMRALHATVWNRAHKETSLLQIRSSSATTVDLYQNDSSSIIFDVMLS